MPGWSLVSSQPRGVHPVVLRRVGHDHLVTTVGAALVSGGNDARKLPGNLLDLLVRHPLGQRYRLRATCHQPLKSVAKAVPNFGCCEHLLKLEARNVPHHVDVRICGGDAIVLRKRGNRDRFERHTQDHAQVIALALECPQGRPQFLLHDKQARSGFNPGSSASSSSPSVPSRTAYTSPSPLERGPVEIFNLDPLGNGKVDLAVLIVSASLKILFTGSKLVPLRAREL